MRTLCRRLAGSIGALLVSIVALSAVSAQGNASVAGLTGAHADLPGVQLWFVDSGGPGEPIVLLHPSTGTSETWEPQIEAFSRAGYRVIAFDRRGWGHSLADPETGPQPGTGADDLDALADHLGLGRFHLVSVAGGGFIALDYAAWRSDRLRSLVVGASTGSVQEPELLEYSARLMVSPMPPPVYREVGPSYRASNPEGTARWLEIEEHARQAGAPTQPQRSPNTYAKLATITTPTLVVAAGADLISPPSLMKLWAVHLPQSEWGEVFDAGHAVAWEQPAVFNQKVLDFIRRNGLRGS